MTRESVWFGKRSNRYVMLLAVGVAEFANPASAGVKTRLYNFENGTPGSTTTTANNSIVGPFKDVPNAVFATDTRPLGEPSDYYDIAPADIPDGTLLGDWVANTYNPSPHLNSVDVGLPTYVNVANGSPLDSPAQGSNVALQFNGSNTILQGQGFRSSFISDAAVAGNQPALNDFTDENNFNVLRSFTVLSQAWVRPSSALPGLSQVVWTVGTENGGVRITADGFWELMALGPPGTRVTSQAVLFDQWTHLAVLRTGGTGLLYVNGTLAAEASGFFNAFGQFVTLGASETLSEPFAGIVDNFSVTGTGGLGITISTDLDVFSDLGLPTPSGVPGDVDQDGDADQTDYNIWSANAGFDNSFGQGDLTTLIKGDLDQNGKVNFFDFRIIAREAAATGAVLSFANGTVPEPAGSVLLMIGLASAAIGGCRRQRAS